MKKNKILGGTTIIDHRHPMAKKIKVFYQGKEVKNVVAIMVDVHKMPILDIQEDKQ